MVVYDDFFPRAFDRKFSMNLKKFLIDNHYKTICGPVRSERTSCRVEWEKVKRLSTPETSDRKVVLKVTTDA